MQEVETISLALLGLSFLFSAIFSGTEAAFLASQPHRLRHLAENGSRGARIAAGMKERPERFLSTLLVGNNLTNTAAAAIATSIALTLLENSEQGLVAATVITTIALLVFAEITPKTVGARHAERVMVILAPPFRVFSFVFAPVTIVFTTFAGFVAWLTGGTRRAVVNAQEFRAMIRTGVEQGTVEEREAELVHKVFQFGDRMVREIMTPRTEIIWVRNGTTLSEFLEIYARHSHSHFPVLGDEPDTVAGILAIKSVLHKHALGELTMNSSITTDLRETHFVPETKMIDDLMDEMRAQRSRMVMVVDEFGDISGLVTLSRAIELIVGRVDDPGDPQAFQAVDERTVRVDGIMHIDELAEQLNIHLPDGDGEYETIAGFVLKQLGRIPEEGEALVHGPYEITVAQIHGARIDEVTVRTEDAG